MSSYRARLNKVRTKVGSDPGIALKISGGGGTAVSMRKAACNQKCVSGSHVGSFSIIGPRPPGNTGLVNVNTRAMLTRKTDYRKHSVGTVNEYTKSGVVEYSYPDKYLSTSGYQTRLQKLMNVNKCDCNINNTEVSETISCCKSIIPGTRHLFPNDSPTTKNTNYVNVVQNENIKISSDYASQISTLNNDRGWVISQ
jgi:hypothetical protein